MKPSKRVFGTEGEFLAARYLEKQGYTLVAQNFYTRFGEIDLIVLREGVLVFVEVKTRHTDCAVRFGRGSLAVDRKKQEKISRSAAVFLEQNEQYADADYRFDVVEVYCGETMHHEIRHTEDAFDCTSGIYI